MKAANKFEKVDKMEDTKQSKSLVCEAGVIVYTVGATFEPGRAPQWAVQYCEYIVLLQTFLCGDSSTMPPPPVLCTQLLWEVIFCCQIFEIIFHYFD